MPSKSKKQQRLMGLVRAVQKGTTTAPSKEIEQMANTMSSTSVKHYAQTKHKDLPEKAARVKISSYMVAKAKESLRSGALEKQANTSRLRAWMKVAQRFYHGEQMVPAILSEYPGFTTKQAVAWGATIIRNGLAKAAMGDGGAAAAGVASAPSMSYNGDVSGGMNFMSGM